ncbi:MAG: pantetheine-phosphate adenylyltransferase [Flavobacteriales bacterium]|nr:pantetheine-phosphate adenylyltransferase [Flavobacteriales bacterium]
MKIAVFPGSFDPLTLGHISIIEAGLKLFDKIIIAIGSNEQKKNMFPLSEREKMIQLNFKDNKNISIKSYKGLTVDFCERENAQHIIRGIRNSNDFNYEQSIAFMNYRLNDKIQTCFLPSTQEYAFISSSIVKEILLNKDTIDKLQLKKKLKPFLSRDVLNQII